MRRRFSQHRQTGLIIGEVQRFTQNTSFTVPKGAYAMDYFIVGGGGGGGSWITWMHTCGMGGNGGCIINGSTPVKQGQVWNVSIGNGGAHSTTKVAGTKSAKDGGATTLSSENVIFQAKGGQGGYNSVNENGGNYRQGFIIDYGSYEIYHGNDNKEYYQGPIIQSNGDNLARNVICDILNRIVIPAFDALPIYNTTAKSRLFDGRGIPEFLEDGNPTHAVSAPTISSLAMPATYGPEPTFNKTSYNNENFGCYSGGGYGAGGAPGYYSGDTISYGGNGISGIVCVRFRG